jgi:hypothetical protein
MRGCACGRFCNERVHAFLDRPSEGDRPCPWIDAAHVKVRQAGRILAIGVNAMAGASCWAWTSVRPKPTLSETACSQTACCASARGAVCAASSG